MRALEGRCLAALILLGGISLTAAAAGAAGFEKAPQTLKAATFVPPKLISGEGYRIGPTAETDGYINTYTLITDWGRIEAVGDYRLQVRLQEVRALRTLDSMSRAGQFGEGLKNGVLAPIEGAYNLLTSPIETTGGAIKGVGLWFGNIARSITSDDPNQEGALSAAAGWAGTKRAFAVELGVDPYTDWEPLQDALVSVARAAFAGGITASVATTVATQDTVAEAPVLGLGLSQQMNELLVDNPPERLTEINRETLQKMGIGDAVATAFLRNYNYSPKEKLQLVDSLNSMLGAKGRELFVTQAAGAPDKAMARYFQQRAGMMAIFHNRIATSDIVEVGQLPMQKTADGRLVGVFPIDYLLWSAEAAAISRQVRKGAAGMAEVKSGELWFEGRVSPQARVGLEALGWSVKEDAGLLITEAR